MDENPYDAPTIPSDTPKHEPNLRAKAIWGASFYIGLLVLFLLVSTVESGVSPIAIAISGIVLGVGIMFFRARRRRS
jgi:hypothetical protein